MEPSRSKLGMVGPLQWVLLSEKGTDNQPALLHTFQYDTFILVYCKPGKAYD